jgi:hypothetical protein
VIRIGAQGTGAGAGADQNLNSFLGGKGLGSNREGFLVLFCPN